MSKSLTLDPAGSKDSSNLNEIPVSKRKHQHDLDAFSSSQLDPIAIKSRIWIHKKFDQNIDDTNYDSGSLFLPNSQMDPDPFWIPIFNKS